MTASWHRASTSAVHWRPMRCYRGWRREAIDRLQPHKYAASTETLPRDFRCRVNLVSRAADTLEDYPRWMYAVPTYSTDILGLASFIHRVQAGSSVAGVQREHERRPILS